jgi:predicted pyridoxine 5'-phosphate oxidase superfamily flavin-nucleotide-binding protein
MAGRIDTLEALEALYRPDPVPASLVKVTGRITPHYRALIEASPFLVLATVGPEGLDCSPRGDQAGFARIADDRTLIIPDRRGNNRIDSLRNIVRDPRVALLFLIPGPEPPFASTAARRSAPTPICWPAWRSTARRRAPRSSSPSRRPISSAPGRSSAPGCGIRPPGPIRTPCPRPARSWRP